MDSMFELFDSDDKIGSASTSEETLPSKTERYVYMHVVVVQTFHPWYN